MGPVTCLRKTEQRANQMSRNFELLQQAEKGELLAPPGVPMPPRQSRPAISSSPPHKRGLANEEITKLVQRLFLHSSQANGPRVVSFTGMDRDDRSSWICACAGISLAAQADTSVCLVDANFSSPQLHIHFDADNRTGLAAALTTEGLVRSFATPVSNQNLWLLSAGSMRGIPYTQERRRMRFSELRKEFDYILICAPSLSHESEATSMGQLADGMVLIVEANQTRRESLRQVKEHLEAAHVKLLGAVLDQRTFPIPVSLYRKL